MGLTTGDGPLTAREGPPTNYEIAGPKHRLLWSEFPRRVRGELAGETVFDTRAGRLLHESEMLPVLYVPASDVADSLLEPSESSSHCPFKGDASYWNVRANGSESTDAVWAYPKPLAEVSWLVDHFAFYWDKLDAWFDEDERVFGHLRDPFHRVDVRRSSAPATASIAGQRVATSEQPWVLSETGIVNRIYFPPEDIDPDALEPSQKRTHCPYKGDATYRSHPASGAEDVAWSYEDPFDDARRVAGCLCFAGEDVEVELG